MEQEAEEESGSLTYEEAKDICLSHLVLVKSLQAGQWVPKFVGRSDVYIVNQNGGLKQKNRQYGADFYYSGDGAPYCWGSVSACTSTLIFDVSNSSSSA